MTDRPTSVSSAMPAGEAGMPECSPPGGSGSTRSASIREDPGPPLDRRLQLDRIVFIGRTCDEYRRFFDLDLSALAGRSILDCASGASSFAAHAHRAGARVTAVDIAYDLAREELEEKGLSDL